MKIDLQKIFDLSNTFASQAGQQLRDWIDYTSRCTQKFILALQNNLTFEDNMRCLVKTVGIEHEVEQIVDTGDKIASHVLPTRVEIDPQSGVDAGFTAFSWRLDESNRLVVKFSLAGSAVPTRKKATVTIVVGYR